MSDKEMHDPSDPYDGLADYSESIDGEVDATRAEPPPAVVTVTQGVVPLALPPAVDGFAPIAADLSSSRGFIRCENSIKSLGDFGE